MSNLNPENLAPETMVAGYEVKSFICLTQMGAVYHAMQKSLNRPVALKVLSHDISLKQSFSQTYLESARTVAALTHLNAVQLFEAGTTDEGLHFIAMEFVPGRDLSSVLDHSEKIPVDRIVEIMTAVASALEQAWEKHQLIHGDINPSNIILRNDGVPKLAEIGLAKTDYNAASSEIFTTPLYVAPEVILGNLDPNEPRSDIYSFGCTLFHLLAGVPPFTGSEPEFIYTKHLEVEPQSIAELRPDLEPEIANLVDRMLQKNLEDRPTSWGEVIQVFTHFKDGPDADALVTPAKASNAKSSAKRSSGKPKMNLHGSSGKMRASRRARVVAPKKTGSLGLIVLALILIVVVAGGYMVFMRAESMKVDADWKQVTDYLQSDATLADKSSRIQDHIIKFGVAGAHPQAISTKKSIIKQIAERDKKKAVTEKIKGIAARKKNAARKKAEYEAWKKARENK